MQDKNVRRKIVTTHRPRLTRKWGELKFYAIEEEETRERENGALKGEIKI